MSGVTDMHLGSGDLSIDDGVNAPRSVGCTNEDGIIINYSIEVYNFLCSRFGTMPVKQVTTGEGLTITANLSETTLENLKVALGGATEVGGKVVVGGLSGRQLPTYKLIFTPDDGSEVWTFPNVSVASPLEISYKATTGRFYPVVFTALADIDSESATYGQLATVETTGS
jgi:hypothetical protein